jgi:hypothetical protein
MLRYLIDGELMTSDQYMTRHRVSYLRAIHEINKHVNQAAIRCAASKDALGTAKRTAGDIGAAIDPREDDHERT